MSTDETDERAPHRIALAQARKRAEWELGDATWADVIVNAYLNPATDAEALKHEQGE